MIRPNTLKALFEDPDGELKAIMESTEGELIINVSPEISWEAEPGYLCVVIDSNKPACETAAICFLLVYILGEEIVSLEPNESFASCVGCDQNCPFFGRVHAKINSSDTNSLFDKLIEQSNPKRQRHRNHRNRH